MTRRRYPIYRLDGDVYIEWVSMCDAPGRAYTRAEIEGMLAEDIAEAEEQLAYLKNRLFRLDTQGHTMLDTDRSVEELVRFNRAGPKEGSVKFSTLLREARAQLAADAAYREQVIAGGAVVVSADETVPPYQQVDNTDHVAGGGCDFVAPNGLFCNGQAGHGYSHWALFLYPSGRMERQWLEATS